MSIEMKDKPNRSQIKKMQKNGMELQISFVVTLILVLVIFSSALVLTFKFFQGAKDLDEKMRGDLTEKIDTILTSGSMVALPESTRTIYLGQHSIYGIGILNLEGKDKNIFFINVQCLKGFDQDDKAFMDDPHASPPATFPGCYDTSTSNYNGCFNMLYNSEETIKNYEKKTTFLQIEPKKTGIAAGSYKCDIYICRDDKLNDGICDGLDNAVAGNVNRKELYDSTIHKITVIIP